MWSTVILPTRVQAKPLSGGVSPGHAVIAPSLATRVTLLPSSRHQRVSVAGFSSTIVLGPCLTLNTTLGSSQHHHHQGKMARNLAFDNLRWMSAVRFSSGAKRKSALRAAAKPRPRTRSLPNGRRSTRSRDMFSTGPGPTGPIGVFSRTLMMCNRSHSHHQGQQNHHSGQHGQQGNRAVHQVKHAVKFPFWSAFTVARGTLL